MVKLYASDRIKIAFDFLSHFSGNNIFVSKFDPPEFNGFDVSEMDKKPWHYHDHLDECAERLLSVNNIEKARGIFFCVNELDQSRDKGRKRTNKMWVRSRAIWCEDDNVRSGDPNDFRQDWPITPNIVVNSSPGKFHYYWLTDTDNSSEWTSVQRRMVSDYKSDKSAKDLARVLRLPGFYHLKNPENKHFVRYIKLRDEPYTWDEIKVAFPPIEEDISEKSKKVEKAKQERTFIRTDPTLDILMDMKLVKSRIEVGTWDITCPWVEEHTNQEDTGTRYFQAHFNGYDQSNFKCNHGHCSKRTIKDLREKIKLFDKIGLPDRVKKEVEVTTILKPAFPTDFMLMWPEPWPLIWQNWKRLPRDLSQPLLTPTILSLHAYILNSKYITEWGRRPNLYQLNLAESTANKDTNSKDVLRALSEIMIRMGILNSLFNIDLFNSESNITSDTAFLQALDKNGGNFYWLNTEATRVFQQLSNSGGGNSAVMALSDKIIEVVDGHGITSKGKAQNRISGCTDPNVQIVFYAQPETIERYINEEMVDSGFLGRAIITLDDKKKSVEKPTMFIRRTSVNKEIDRKLAEFYASRTIGSPIKEVFRATPDERGFEELTNWSESFIHPMLDITMPHNSAMYKMVSRIGNTAEQLYCIILGICREWDMFNSEEPRTAADINPNCMFPILEFWAKSKAYVVNEYISIESDPIAKCIEQVLLRYIKRDVKIDRAYEKILEERGMVPRSVLMRAMRNQGSLKRKMNMTNNDLFLTRVNMVLDMLVQNDILREEMLARSDRLIKAKKTKFIGFL